jgi:DNA polymerase-3 subunit epsilon
MTAHLQGVIHEPVSVPPEVRCPSGQGGKACAAERPAPRWAQPKYVPFSRFAAIDFETADYGRDSACAVAVVVAEQGRIVQQMYSLIRPPRRDFVFSYLHGITWNDVAQKPHFGELWPQLVALLEGVEFVAAHNASFDRGVLTACCAGHGVTPVELPYLCTMKLSRRHWKVRPTKLSDVCRHFSIPLNHHEALSDALACAHIVLKAADVGVHKGAFLGK